MAWDGLRPIISGGPPLHACAALAPGCDPVPSPAIGRVAELGRRAGFRFLWGQPRGGSNPLAPTLPNPVALDSGRSRKRHRSPWSIWRRAVSWASLNRLARRRGTLVKRAVRVLCLLLVLSAAVAASVAAGGRAAPPTYPIKHVVVIFQENNSFDHLLGKLCVDEQNRCDGTTEGKLSHGKTIPLAPRRRHSAGHRPLRGHDADGHRQGTDGRMGSHPACTEAMGYQCLEQDDPRRIPTLASLADTFVISDRTFQLYTPSSWGAHLDLVSATCTGSPATTPTRPASAGPRVGLRFESRCAMERSEHPGVQGDSRSPRAFPTGREQGPYRIVAGPVRPHDHGPPGGRRAGPGRSTRPRSRTARRRVTDARSARPSTSASGRSRPELHPVDQLRPRRAGGQSAELLRS